MSVPSRAVVTDVHTFLRSRRSVRRFKPDPVPAPVLERILETAAFAPSAHNLQPWRFAVVTTSAIRARLGLALTAKMRADMRTAGAPESEIEARAERSRRRLDEAPVVIMLCRDVKNVRVEDREEALMAIQSVAGCGLQLLLAAHAEGLGGNWICWPLYAQEAAREALGLPESWEPQAMFFLGFADGESKEKVLKPFQEVVRFV
jgi:coenzyme F420-0:L-glutamate ligase / coenzyme F420-1:gamma-L-glutamate ligase